MVLRTWLRIIHCNIFCSFTIPRAINSATLVFPQMLGRKSFRTSPQFDSVASLNAH